MAEKKAKEEGEVVEAPAKKSGCGHLNLHHKGLKGGLEPLACTQPAGHGGNHSAKYKSLRKVDDNYETAVLVEQGAKTFKIAGIMYAELEEVGEWSDAAGVLATEIIPDEAQLAELRRNKRKLTEQ